MNGPDEGVVAQATRLAADIRALGFEGRWVEALAPARQAAKCHPSSPRAALDLGILLSKLGQLQEAEAELRRGLALDPASPPLRFSLACNLLAQGRYEEAWPLYRAREEIAGLSRGIPKDLPYPRWVGESLAGKRIVVFPEQGLGDQIQFARFLPRLIDQAEHVVLLTAPALERLFRHNFPAAEVIPAIGAVEFPDPDYWITSHHLPAVFGVDLRTIPAEPYLRAPGPSRVIAGDFKIGVKTKGNARHANDRQRSLPESCAAQLRSSLPGTVISLEPEDSGAADMADTAAIIDQLDLVVSVDTSVAHLAGALGKPCLLLLPGFGPDWRWMTGRDDSPWYPQHTLFRGTIDGGWQEAMDRVLVEAKRRAAPALARAAGSRPAAARGSLADTLLRGQALCGDARYPEAIDVFRRAVRAAPGNPAPLNLLGAALTDVGRLAEAEQYHRRALALAPDYPVFQNMLALNLLAQGRYREAWPLHEARNQKTAQDIGFPTGVPCARWRGESLAGKHIVVLPEQGFGDSIQFFRFLPRLRETGARITLFARPTLVDLFQTSLAARGLADVAVRPAAGEVRLGHPDYWTTLVDMMRPLDIVIEDVPSEPYLSTDRTWPAFPEGFTVGLVSSGNPAHANDKRRSLTPEMAARLRDGLPGTIISLDPRDSKARDFADTAALIQQLDLVVSVDSSVAHLAGALGKRCLLLVPGIGTDWRWMRDRDDTPWYSQHRLFRSDTDGDWRRAIDAAVACARRICEEA